MAFTTIDDPSKYFQTVLYTGNGSSQSITFDGNSDMQPDFLWTKCRSTTFDPIIRDTSRGISERLLVHANDAAGGATGTTAFNSDGFSLDSTNTVNNNTNTYVAWGWKANGGTRTTNSESGNNPAGGYQANTTAGFSIVDYTGTGAAGTMAHGLGAVPTFMIVKNRDEAVDWAVYHQEMSTDGNDSYLEINTSDAAATAGTVWNDTTPTSTVFTVGSNNKTNKDGVKYIAYCFTSIKGYSKFGDYQGNGNDNGPFVFTGFKPAWLMIKRTTANQWGIYDNTISPFNEITANLDADSNSAENTATNYDDLDFLSNGFKLREENDDINADGGAYVYFAFAEHPFVSSKGIPTTAR